MAYLVTSEEMKQYDKNTMEYYQIPSVVLKERAALAVYDEVRARFQKMPYRILVLCGNGNNGGDGLAIARLLFLNGYSVQILFPMDSEKMTEETKRQFDTASKYEIPIAFHMNEVEEDYDIIIDALFGIGLSRDIDGELAEILVRLNATAAYRIAVDIPSGIDADSGKILGTAFCAKLTVTFGFAKVGELLYPGAEYTGELITADIGIDEKSMLKDIPFGRYLNPTDVNKRLPKRSAYSNKGSYGKVLMITGSVSMAGAAYLSAKAAYYAGCGLVRIFTVKENRNILLTRLPEAILTTYDADAKDNLRMLEDLEECMNWADALLIGPGIGITYASKLLLAKVLQASLKNVVFDADALNILSKNMALLKEAKCKGIVTPHIGEMSRLTGLSVEEVRENLIQNAVDFAREYRVICVLKDARTIIAMPDGTYYINTTGNHGMATGGSGDVLAGMMTGFLAQNATPQEAAVLSTYLHGLSGDYAAKERGAYSMLSSDILEQIPKAIQVAANGGMTQNEKI